MTSLASSASQTSGGVVTGQRGRHRFTTARGGGAASYTMGIDSALRVGPTGARGAGCASAAGQSLADAVPSSSRSILVDVDGLRCEVRSMRSVPHALYSTLSVSHVLAAYVQQLIDDFTGSLLLCRPATRCARSSSSPVVQAGSATPPSQRQLQSSTATTLCAADLTVNSALSSEDEEACLWLRLCHLHREKQRQSTPPESTGADVPAMAERRKAGARTGSVAEQLMALFATADQERCRHGRSGRARERDGESHDAAAALMPSLLSSRLRFQPMLQDMRYLAQHLLLPRHAWPYQQREWVIVYEDVAVTLRDRLSRYRRSAMRGMAQGAAGLCSNEDDTENRDAAGVLTDKQQLYPAEELHQLWHTLWELLGAAWRQRDRLWGAYRHLHGPHRLPPLCLSGQAPHAVPPGVHACPIVREQYEASLARVRSSAACPSHPAPAAPAAPHAEDSCAFGPFTSADIGISAQRLYVLRQPLAAVLRTLRVSVPSTGRGPILTSATALAGSQYVDDPLPRSEAASTLVRTTDAATPLIVPLFDTTTQDAQLASAAVPYVSPEVYVSLQQAQQQQQQQRRQSASSTPSPMVAWPPVHSFSDDVWNAAVVVLEAALSGFCATDAFMCHLARPSLQSRGADLLDAPTASSVSSASSSVYSDVLLLLRERHAMPRAAAHNFLYTALHHLQAALKQCSGDVLDDRGNDDGTTAAALPSPTRLADEWVCYLCRAYGLASLESGGVIAEVASKGLHWRRSERWNTFGMAHFRATTASTSAAWVHGWPSTSSYMPSGMAGGAGGHRHAPAAAICAVSTLAGTAVGMGTPEDADDNVDGFPASVTGAMTSVRPQPPAGPLGSVAQRESAGVTGTSAPSSPLSVLTPLSPASLSANGGSDAAALLWRPQRQLDRTFGTLDTPLLRLPSPRQCCAALEGKPGGTRRWRAVSTLGRTAAAPAAAVGPPTCGATDDDDDDAGDVWAVLSSHLRRGRMTAISTGTPAAPAGKANGSAAEAGDADCVDELLRLLFFCLVRAIRCYHADNGARTAIVGDAAGKGDAPADVEWYQYAAMNHPFFRGVAERGLLTTYKTVACCSGGGGGFSASAFAATTLPALNLYIPAAVLLATVREMKATWKASSDNVCPERVVKQATSLRTLIGDDMRAWETSSGGSRGRTHLQQQQYPLPMNLFMDTAATLLPPPVNRAQRALDSILSPIDLDLAAQLEYTQQLRRLLRGGSDVAAAAGVERGHGGKAAAAAVRVRAYLNSFLMPNTDRGTDGVVAYSPFYPLPPTLRGEVWGCLLRVPPSACTREALLAHAVHETAAKPTPHDRQLSVDIPRCHAYHPLLSSSSGSAQLKRILRAWLYLHPKNAYWQGLDSVCAVLLTVSNTNEALVLAQLTAIVDRFIAHDEDRERPRTGAAASPLLAVRKPSMAEQLRRLVVVLRYCDPLLAHYLFDVLGCTPELYAIGWLLTLFSHSLPARKVYLLWDFLFVEDDVAGLVALCAVFMVHKREVLMSTDFSGCLASFSSGASSMNVAAVVGDARWLMKVVPPSVLAPPPVSSGKRQDALDTVHGCGRADADAAIDRPRHSGDDGNGVTAVALLAVEDVAAALAASGTEISDGGGKEEEEEGSGWPHWFDSGVYLVDVREQPAASAPQDAVLGAIRVPLCAAACPTAHAPATSATAAEAGAPLACREVPERRVSVFANDVGDTDDDMAGDTAGAGWGIVEQQELMQEQQRAEQEAVARQVEDAAAIIVRCVRNPAMAAITPRVWRAPENHAAPSRPSSQPSWLSCPWPVHPIVLKASRALHVVLLTSGVADAHELALAHQLGVKLNACGVHNVSILRGGVASVRRALPELVVRCAPST